jgi:Zn-dependent M28 family amino/carboxypeptidase
MDSRSTDSKSKTQPAPGANDSGSQTSVVLEAARAMVGHTFQATVVFAAFTGEEQGLQGSKSLAGHLGDLFPGAKVEAALISDIVGGDVSANDATSLKQFRVFATGTPRERSSSTPAGTTDDTSPARGLMRAIAVASGAYVTDMTLLPNLREDRPGRGSDHISFLDKALPGVRFIEAKENTSHQHNGNDTIANMTLAYMPRIARVMVASAASLARAPAAPSPLSVSGSATSPVTVSWSASASPNVDHYVVAARRISSNFYVNRVTVAGGATSATVTASQLGITGGAAFFISVAAVDAAGHESLFGYPEYRCASVCEIQPGSLDVTRTI